MGSGPSNHPAKRSRRAGRHEGQHAVAELSWAPPTDDGGDPTITYTITYTGTADGSCVTTTTSCQITNLTNGVLYTFTVTATNCGVQTHSFLDVSVDSFASSDIGCIYTLGVTRGTSPTTYNPSGNVTREQMAAFLARIYRTIIV